MVSNVWCLHKYNLGFLMKLLHELFQSLQDFEKHNLPFYPHTNLLELSKLLKTTKFHVQGTSSTHLQATSQSLWSLRVSTSFDGKWWFLLEEHYKQFFNLDMNYVSFSNNALALQVCKYWIALEFFWDNANLGKISIFCKNYHFAFVDNSRHMPWNEKTRIKNKPKWTRNDMQQS